MRWETLTCDKKNSIKTKIAKQKFALQSMGLFFSAGAHTTRKT